MVKKQSIAQLVVGLLILLFIVSCSSSKQLAPVVDIRSHKTQAKSSRYKVKRGDTLYSIAWRYDMDYHRLAEINGISSPFSLHVGQVISLKPVKKWPVTTSRVKEAQGQVREKKLLPKMPANTAWRWPLKGKVVTRFSPYKGKKGIDIATQSPVTVRASQNGIVAYSGTGLPGYGKLIIIKHNHNYLSAYAFNSKLYVKEGQVVSAGQRIARVGRLQSRHLGLHFEIRKAGKPVNPMKLLG